MQWKRKRFHQSHGVEPKKGILRLGMQPCGKIWVFSDSVFINAEGIVTDSHPYAWLSRGVRASLMCQKEVPLDEIPCTIKEPLSISPFHKLLLKLEDCLQQNYLSCILLMGGSVMSFHYTIMQDIFGWCPQVNMCRECRK